MAEVMHIGSNAPDPEGLFVLIEHAGDAVDARDCVVSIRPEPEADEFTPEAFAGLDAAIDEGVKLAGIYSLPYVYVQNV